MDAFLMTGQVAVVTGGGSGIGRASARALGAAGAHVVACGRSSLTVEQTAASIRAAGGSAQAVVLDVTDVRAVAECFPELAASHGHVDVLINSAGMADQAMSTEQSQENWDRVLATNLSGTFFCAQAFARLESQGPRSIVNVSSLASTKGVNGQAAYSASKGGVDALTRSLAVEWGDRGIRMNAIAPGPIPTEGAFSRLLPRPELEQFARERNPLRRFGTTEELANLAAFLVSDGSGYINGEVVVMDGGEQLQGAGEFSALGRLLTEDDWKSMKPRKAPKGE